VSPAVAASAVTRIRACIVSATLLAIAAGCAQAAADFPTYRSAGGEPRFSVEYPGWPSRKSGNPFNVVEVVRPDRQCYFDLAASEAPLDQLEGVVRKYMQEQHATIVSRSPLAYEFSTDGGKYNFVARTRGMDCGDKSYLATMTCLRERFDQPSADRAFGSMTCTAARGAQGAGAPAPAMAPAPAPRARADARAGARPLVGVVISPAGEFNARNVRDAFRIAREGGAQITRTFVSWTDIESRKGRRDWEGTDGMMQLVRGQGLRVVVSFNAIHTAVRGPLPDDLRFKGWNDAALIDRFSDFVVAFLQRYADLVDYVELGNEVNAYFTRHPDEMASYREFFTAVRARIRKQFPDVKVGLVFAFHEMQARGDFSVYEQLRVGDYDGFTLYVYRGRFRFDRPAQDVADALEQIARLTGAREFAVDEIGWSASPALGGSEVSQRDAVAAAFDFLDRAPGRLLFMNWFGLHDGRRHDCDRIARTFVKPGDAMSGDADAMRVFSDYLCNLGLRANDGKPRAAWNEWVRRARALETR
jgi:hypothetical protein